MVMARLPRAWRTVRTAPHGCWRWLGIPGAEQELLEGSDGGRPRPVTLQLADEFCPAHWSRAGLKEARQPGSMCLDGRSSDGIDNRIRLVAVTHRVQEWKRQAHLGPQCHHDELPPTGCLHRAPEVDVLPRIHRGAIDRLDSGPDIGEWADRRSVGPGAHVDRGQHDW